MASPPSSVGLAIGARRRRWCWDSPGNGPIPGCGRICASGSASSIYAICVDWKTTWCASASRRPSQAPTASTSSHPAGGPRPPGARRARRRPLAPVPGAAWLRAAGLRGCAVFGALVFRAMIANRFFSSVVRIQTDRGTTWSIRVRTRSSGIPGTRDDCVDAVQRAGPGIVAGVRVGWCMPR